MTTNLGDLDTSGRLHYTSDRVVYPLGFQKRILGALPEYYDGNLEQAMFDGDPIFIPRVLIRTLRALMVTPAEAYELIQAPEGQGKLETLVARERELRELLAEFADSGISGSVRLGSESGHDHE